MPSITESDVDDSGSNAEEASLVAALSVYLEPIASDARVLVVGDMDAELSDLLEEMGARSVHRHEPSLDVRDGAFDVAVVPDLNALDDIAGTLSRLRRVVDARGAVIAMGRARTEVREPKDDAFPDLAPAMLGYAELYDQFALRFDHVSMTGVVPFRGVVFAELGHEESDVGVSVDTRLVDAPPPDVFVVVASREPVPLEPYAIVQIGSESAPRRDLEAEAAFAAMHLKAELLAAQLDEQRARVAAAEARSTDDAPRVARILAERDAAVTRAAELEAIVLASQQALTVLEKKLIAAEEGMLDRDDRIAVLNAELDTRTAELDARNAELDARNATPRPDPTELAHLVARTERAEAALALHVADLAQVVEAHAFETAGLEEQLRERAQVIAALEKEIFRREQLVRELVTSLEEAGEHGANGYVFAEAAPLSVPPPPAASPPPAAPDAAVSELRDENARLRKKLDELAMEVARREGELRAQGWRLTELENAGGRGAMPANGSKVLELERDLAKSREELDALRQALRQEHALVEQLRSASSGELGRGG
jgi:hypothetical protein